MQEHLEERKRTNSQKWKELIKKPSNFPHKTSTSTPPLLLLFLNTTHKKKHASCSFRILLGIQVDSSHLYTPLCNYNYHPPRMHHCSSTWCLLPPQHWQFNRRFRDIRTRSHSPCLESWRHPPGPPHGSCSQPIPSNNFISHHRAHRDDKEGSTIWRATG